MFVYFQDRDPKTQTTVTPCPRQQWIFEYAKPRPDSTDIDQKNLNQTNTNRSGPNHIQTTLYQSNMEPNISYQTNLNTN